jgi:hypothetical protein
MNGDTTTGPLILGRWQKPAALINAGLVPPDPYPVEKLLFCAGCGQQFFGTHIAGGANRAGGTHIGDTRIASGTHQAGGTPARDGAHVAGGIPVAGGARFACGTRVYRTFCDCRPGPLPANDVELQVYAETHIHAFDTDTVTGLTTAHYALLAFRFFTRVELGPTADHILFSHRI